MSAYDPAEEPRLAEGIAAARASHVFTELAFGNVCDVVFYQGLNRLEAI
jgi:hypothetical protein